MRGLAGGVVVVVAAVKVMAVLVRVVVVVMAQVVSPAKTRGRIGSRPIQHTLHTPSNDTIRYDTVHYFI